MSGAVAPGQASATLGRSARPRGAAPAPKQLSIIALVFLIGLVLPIIVYIGPLRLSVYRGTLLVLLLPMIIMLVSGKAGRVRYADIFLILLLIWSTLSLIVVHGIALMVEPIGMMWVETLGAYLVARVFVRSVDQFVAVVRILYGFSVLFLPLLLYENVSGHDIILEVLNRIATSLPEVLTDPRYDRLGLDRAQGPFSHPIHNGVFFGSILGLSYYVLGYGKRLVTKLLLMAVPMVAGATALSSGPLVAITAQLNLIAWDVIFKRVKHHWYILLGLVISGYVVIDMLSNRTPFHVLVSYFTLSPDTAYNRIRIFDYGVASIFANPVFGIGFGDWEHPAWMSDSADMFWIIAGMRHGIPAWILTLAFFFAIFLPVALRPLADDRLRAYRTGYLVTLLGFFLVGWTVHFWEMLYAYFMFIMGVGVWFLDADGSVATEDGAARASGQGAGERKLAYSRFDQDRHRAGTERAKAGG